MDLRAIKNWSPGKFDVIVDHDTSAKAGKADIRKLKTIWEFFDFNPSQKFRSKEIQQALHGAG